MEFHNYDINWWVYISCSIIKYNLAKILSSYILALAGTNPRNVLLAIMCVLFLSMWISNVAAPFYVFINSTSFKKYPHRFPVAKAFVGIALASDVAGMASPIASPQNVIALESMNLIQVGEMVCCGITCGNH